MGSQTLEIMRQGFWASFTGGWFFDPHQDIFCNTFHMYLWMCLLLTPFVLYLTAETTIVPMVLYPICICLIFAVIKYTNHKLHILFDGEELLEERTSKRDSKDDSKDAKDDKNEADVEDDILKFIDSSQTNVSNKCDIETPQISLSLKEEINDALTKSGDKEDAVEIYSAPEPPDNSVSNTELVTATTPHVYSHEQACIVDLHHTKVMDKDVEELEKKNNRETNKQGKDGEIAVATTVEFLTGHDDDNYLIIANEPTVSDFHNTSDPNSKSYKATTEQFPLNLHKLVDSSSGDSSWASSSIFSSESEINDVKVKFMPVDASGQQALMTDSNIGAVKSKNTLSTIEKDAELDSGKDKTASLPDLESEDVSKQKENTNRYNSGGARPRITHNVGFSLPEIELYVKGDEQKTSLQSESLSKSDDVVADGEDDDSEEKASHVKRPRRMGAFRASGSEMRPYLRFRNRANSESPGTSLLQGETEPAEGVSDSRHFAISHEDTTSGAVHYFHDEYGKWFSYAFGDTGAQPLQIRSFLADGVPDMVSVETIPRRRDSIGSSLSQQDMDPVLRELTSELTPAPHRWRTHSNPFFRSQFNENKVSIRVEEPTPKKYYLLPIIKSYSVKISFDRLALLALLDRNKNTLQAILSVILATLVALLGYILLTREYFYDFWLFVMCFVIAKCQFSLLKSVQPDSASPIHGHNNAIVFSRAIYFCITSVLIIGVDEAAKLNPVSTTLYGIPLYSQSTLVFAKDLLIASLLAFPLMFVLGLLPQVNTLIMHVLEQFDVHVFGGSAMTSMLSSFYSIFRSIVCVTILSAVCYVPLKYTEEGENKGQHVMFSVFAGLLMAVSYHLSRSTSSPEILFLGLKRKFSCSKAPGGNSDTDIDDPLPEKLIETIQTRLVHDGIVCIVVAFVVFAVHVSTVFTSLQPTLSYTLFGVTGTLGVFIHYLLPQLRKQLPWLLISSPLSKSYEYHLYEWQEHSKIMWIEKLYVWLSIGEKNILYPLVCMSSMTYHTDEIVEKFGPLFGAFLITITSLKLLRSCFTNTPRQHIILIWTVLFFNFDYDGYSESFLVDYFIMSIFVEKMLELYLKFKFILTYSAPWQIMWGSAFHAFAQPVSLPHCGMLFMQAMVSAFFSSPLNPFLGSAIFITSYMRPIKFWEKDYNTKRVDHSNTRLSSHIESNPGADDNNLNSIFYEHLTRSLQHSLCGDLLLGRWGNFSSGDCFIMASDYLNALVHIIEVGNGYITFQLRGLEFRGTYCQQREVEAITENVDDDKGCCCFNPGHLGNMLSLNAAFGQRWLAWEVVQSKYILEGYSVSDNTATTMFQMFDLRKIFITYYVTSIIFYCVRNKKLKNWLADTTLMDQLAELTSPNFIDLDTIFRPVTDKDYDLSCGGVTRHAFCQSYHDWLTCCNQHREKEERIKEVGAESKVVTLCFALSLLGRRLLSTASNNQWNAALKSFLHGLHALFKGDFRVTAPKDEWVFSDPDLALLRMVVAPAVRMALKLHQDHFTCVDEFEDNNILYDTISQHEDQFVICHEGHPAWRQAVLHNKPNLLALRYVMDDGTDDYKIIMLNKRCLNFRVIKVNKECVRGLWAGQLQELIFLRNRNPERGSIQNAKQALRNMINSSCDQPIGYPIYVSPLTTSYTETNPFFSGISIGSVNGRTIRSFFQRCYRSMLNQYAGHCRRSEITEVEMEMSYIPTESTHNPPVKQGSTSYGGKVAIPPKGLNFRTGSYTSIPSSSNNSSTSSSSQSETQAIAAHYPVEGKARLRDISRVTEALNSKLFSELNWTNISALKERANMGSWFGWYPRKNLIGDVLYHWEPEHKDVERRSHLNKKIYLLKIENYIVPVVEDGVILLNEDMREMEI